MSRGALGLLHIKMTIESSFLDRERLDNRELNMNQSVADFFVLPERDLVINFYRSHALSHRISIFCTILSQAVPNEAIMIWA